MSHALATLPHTIDVVKHAVPFVKTLPAAGLKIVNIVEAVGGLMALIPLSKLGGKATSASSGQSPLESRARRAGTYECYTKETTRETWERFNQE